MPKLSTLLFSMVAPNAEFEAALSHWCCYLAMISLEKWVLLPYLLPYDLESGLAT